MIYIETTKAQERYDERIKIVADQITVIESLLEVHQQRQTRDPGNWGYVGDLSMMTDSLIEVIGFMNGGNSK